MLCLPTGKEQNKIRGRCSGARSVHKTMVIGDGDDYGWMDGEMSNRNGSRGDKQAKG